MKEISRRAVTGSVRKSDTRETKRRQPKQEEEKMSQELEPVYAGEAGAIQEEGGEQNSFLNGVTGQTPWWIVSVLMHALIITLAALLSVAIDIPDAEFGGFQVTEFYNPKQFQAEVKEQ